MAHEHDVWNKTFYHRLIQTSVGSGLRALYDLSEPVPDRLTRLLHELEDLERDEPQGGGVGEDPPQNPGSGALDRDKDRQ
ncbi:MAG TPA: NepR family anti-sigma factor [Xanthobacteraceae bacterium]|nr:NepR family anti-sigma factor [Xanthobacteraceae bacterium]